MEKKCRTCGETKALTEFYKHPTCADGHRFICKPCQKLDSARRQVGKVVSESTKVKRALRNRRRNETRRHESRFKTNNKAVKAAIRAFPNAPSGMLRHHWSYKREHWKDVLFVLPYAHSALHLAMRFDEGEQCFRTPHGHLLDTKRKHVRWMVAVLNERSSRLREAA